MPPTPKQEKLAEAIILNATSDKPKTTSAVLLSVGYGQGTVKGGTERIIEKEGVQEALIARGFTLENAQKVVADIMLKETAKDRDRLTAADMTIKVHGGYAPEKKIIQSTSVEGSPQDYVEAKALAERYELEYLQGLKTE